MTNNAEPITVMILDREYRFACEPEERQQLLEAAHQLDMQMREIRNSGRLMALERIAVMAALNLTDELLTIKKHDTARRDKIDSRIRHLADKLDGALSAAMD